MTDLQTFALPDAVSGQPTDKALADQMIRAWRRDGIFQVAMNPAMEGTTQRAFEASRRFFRLPLEAKSRCVSDLTYSGYIASGEEVTAGEADYSEIFTVTQDVSLKDARVRAQWPCHGPAPWPDEDYRQGMTGFTDALGSIGERLLRLLGPPTDEFIHYGTHFTHMFMRCYPDRVTTRRILDEERLSTLAGLRDASVEASAPVPVRTRAVA